MDERLQRYMRDLSNRPDQLLQKTRRDTTALVFLALERFRILVARGFLLFDGATFGDTLRFSPVPFGHDNDPTLRRTRLDQLR